MTFDLTDELQEVPWANGVKSREPRVRLKMVSGNAELYLNVAAQRALGIFPPREKHVRLLASRSCLALEIADEITGRKMRQDGAIRVKALVNALHLRAGDNFLMDARIEDGRLICDMPGTLFMRRMAEERRAKREAAA